MNLLIYAGEVFSQSFDFDASSTDAGYALTAPTFRMGNIGSPEAVLEAALTVDDATDGIATLTLPAEVTAVLTTGVYGWQILDTLVLATGTAVVLPMLETPVVTP